MRLPLPAAVPAALALVLVLALASPAAAAPAGDRAAAQAFGAAADRLHAAARAAAPEVARRFDALLEPACARALGRAPRSRRALVEGFATALALDAVLTPVRPGVDAFVAELEAVRTEDRILRRARAAWRRMAGLMGLARPVPADACAQLDAWRRAGYPKDALPAIPRLSPEELEQVEALEDRTGPERRLRRAARHLRRLGVSRRTARRFTGATVAAALGDGVGRAEERASR